MIHVSALTVSKLGVVHRGMCTETYLAASGLRFSASPTWCGIPYVRFSTAEGARHAGPERLEWWSPGLVFCGDECMVCMETGWFWWTGHLSTRARRADPGRHPARSEARRGETRRGSSGGRERCLSSLLFSATAPCKLDGTSTSTSTTTATASSASAIDSGLRASAPAPSRAIRHLLLPPPWGSLSCRRSIGIPPCCMFWRHADGLAAGMHMADDCTVGGFCCPSPWSWYIVLNLPPSHASPTHNAHRSSRASSATTP